MTAGRGSFAFPILLLIGSLGLQGCYGEAGLCTSTSFDLVDEIALTEAEAGAAPILIGHLRSHGELIRNVATPVYVADPEAADESSREILGTGTDDQGAILLDLTDELTADLWQRLIFLPTSIRVRFQPVGQVNGVDYCWASAEIPFSIERDPNRPPPGARDMVPEFPQVTEP